MDRRWMFPESREEVEEIEQWIASGRARLLDRTKPGWHGRKGGWLVQFVPEPPGEPKRWRWFPFSLPHIFAE